jgi:hypothetical protein
VFDSAALLSDEAQPSTFSVGASFRSALGCASSLNSDTK